MTFKSICCTLAALFTIGLSSAGATPVSFASSDTPLAIPDPGSVSSTISVAGYGRVLDINALVNISHTWVGDLVLTLSHNGTSVILSDRNGGSAGADYDHTLFNDSAAIPIYRGDVYPPYTGSYAPQQALSAFNDQDIHGDWTFTVADMEEGDSGVIQNWSLQAEVPEPASLALFAGSLAAMVGARRRRSRRG